jgi:hypothetical protein
LFENKLTQKKKHCQFIRFLFFLTLSIHRVPLISLPL